MSEITVDWYTKKEVHLRLQWKQNGDVNENIFHVTKCHNLRQAAESASQNACNFNLDGLKKNNIFLVEDFM